MSGFSSLRKAARSSLDGLEETAFYAFAPVLIDPGAIPGEARILANGSTEENREAARIQAGKLAQQVLEEANVPLSTTYPPLGANFSPHDLNINVTFYFPHTSNGIVSFGEAKEPDTETLQRIHNVLKERFPAWGVHPFKGGVIISVDRGDIGFRELIKGRINRALTPFVIYEA